ncbi:MAG: 30S ribosomal protein S16 [Clostridia bacterium]
MAVKMRLARIGDNKSPYYRIVVLDGRKARNGEYADLVGTYNPRSNPVEIKIDAEKAKKWLSCGVQPTETVKGLLVTQGIIAAKAKKE